MQKKISNSRSGGKTGMSGPAADTPGTREHAGNITEWRPPTTTAQAGSAPVDWTRTYHVDTPEAFINGLFGLYAAVFQDFLTDAGSAATIGATVLYQVRTAPQLRFELKKIGPNEFEVRGAHFATPAGCNICIGFQPQGPGKPR